MMFRKCICLLALLSMAEGCAYMNLKGLLPSKYKNPSPVGTETGEDTTTAGGNSESVTMTDAFSIDDFSSTIVGIFDNGCVTLETTFDATFIDVAPANAPISATHNYICPTWVAKTQHNQMTYVYNVIYKVDQYNAGGTAAIGADICYLESVYDAYKSWEDSPAKQLLLVTWKYAQTDGTVDALFQLALVLTDSGKTFAIMYYDDAPAFSTTYSGVTVPFGQIFKSPATVAGICADTDLKAELQSRSNTYCGSEGRYVFDLSDSATFVDSYTKCASLNTDDPDKHTRNSNFRETVEVHDTCYARGYCNYTDVGGSSLDFEFLFLNTDVIYSSFAMVDSTFVRLQTGCTFPTSSVTTESAGFKVKRTTQKTQITDCGGSFNDATGEAIIYVLNYNSSDGIDVFTHKTNFYTIKCYPGDFKFTLQDSFTVGDVISTAVPDQTPTLSLEFRDKATNGQPIVVANGVPLGTRIYLQACLTKGANYPKYAMPYGIYGINCIAGDTSDFSGNNLVILKDRCVEGSRSAFKLETSFTAVDGSAPTDDPFCIVAGPFKAARWVTSTDIWVKCFFDTCSNDDTYSGSYCENSCTGTYRDKAKRDVSSTSSVQSVTAHLRVVDENEEARSSCTDKTVALTAISVMVFLLLVAMGITAMLLAKMRLRKTK